MSPQYHGRRVNARHLAGVAIWLAISACARDERPSADTRAIDTAGVVSGPDTGAMTPVSTLNDAQIAHVAVTANAIDSATGELAKQKGRSKAVRDFAQTMIIDHTSVNKQAVALATRLKVTPQENDVSRQLQRDADQAGAILEGKRGAAFDQAYIDREVAYHQAVLDALDNTLVPGARNAELKQLLQSVRPNIAAHLERAKGIQGGLGTQ
jgi:putative membrane protein